MHISEEDMNDSFVDVLNTYKTQWATNWAKKFDNACLGVTVAGDGTDTAPYTSVYREVSQYNSASNLIQTAGAVTFADLNDVLSKIEQSSYFDAAKTAFIIHPSFLGTLRGLVDDNNRPILQDPLGARGATLFGYPVVVSAGAATSSAASAAPAGNPLLIVGNTDLMVNGVRAGIESMVSKDAKFDTDGVLLKVRARRAFAVAKPEGFAIVEKTA
jgi:HK97 family phage major capsid protein